MKVLFSLLACMVALIPGMAMAVGTPAVSATDLAPINDMYVATIAVITTFMIAIFVAKGGFRAALSAGKRIVSLLGF